MDTQWNSSTAKPESPPTDGFASGADRQPTAETIYALGQLLSQQGKDERSELAMKEAIKKDPEYIPAYSSLAALQMRNQRRKDAIRALQAGLDHSPNDPTLLNNLAMCWLTADEYEKSLAFLTKAAGLRPQNARYRGNMAVVLGLMGRYEEARSLFLQTLPPLEAHRNMSILAKAREDESLYTEELLEIYRLKNQRQTEE
ncbi:MAG: tetratricopeptide repeat protein [Planctomycetota bacterium]